MTELQKQAFLDGEGDQWFKRNAAHLSQGDNDVVVDAITALDLHPRAICEIGAANGHRIDALCKRYSARGAGVEPSAAAVADGNSRYPDLDLRVGAADALPFESGAFDLVILGFCMYLVDPDLHFRAVAEADRVLAEGGAMVVFDFVSAQPHHNNYAHLDGLRAHKMEFSRLFLAHPAYTLVRRELAKKSDAFLKSDHREGADVLVKNMAEAFPTNPRKR